MKKLFLSLTLILTLALVIQAQKVEVLGDAMITGQLEVMDTILFADGSQLASACRQVLQDADQDTKITVEHLPDSDEIHLISEGETVMIIDQQRLRIMHNGNSMFFGDQAGGKDDGNNGNIFIGNGAGKTNTFGSKNIYIGTNAAQSNQTGTQNVYIGEEAGGEESGANNTFLGAFSGFSNFGNQNTMIGHQSGESLSGDGNTIIGASAGANASGDGNVIIGKDAGKSAVGDNQLIIHNTDSNTPLISGRFDNETLTLNADATIEKNLNVREGIALLNLPPTLAGEGGLKFGFEGEEKFGITSSRFTIPVPPFNTFDFLHLGHYNNGSLEKTITIREDGRVGIGTTLSQSTKFDVVSSSPIGHIMKIENTAPGIEGDGLEIKLNRPTNGAGNNFITFNDQDGVAGRIEGFSTSESNGFTNFPTIDFSLYYSPITIENLAFDPGVFPSLSGGQLPSLSGGSFPNFNPGSFPNLNPGSLPTLSGGSFGSFNLQASFDADAVVANLLCGPLCPPALIQEVYTFNPTITGASFPTLNSGTLPSITGGQVPTLSGGSFPTLNVGQLPTLSIGQLPSIDFDVIFDPTPIASAYANLQNIMCWALENGERSLITSNPYDIGMMSDPEFLSRLANCKNGGVTYGSGGADYAEYLMREDFEEVIEEGQIVGVKGGKISKNTEDAEQLLVISMMPIVLGNMPDDTATIDQHEKVAFLGQAPVWVVGKVRSGDYIIPSGRNDGYGMAVAPNDLKLEHIGKIVGKAWSDGENAINMVNMAIGLKTNELAQILKNNAEQMSEFEGRLAKLEALMNSDLVVAEK